MLVISVGVVYLWTRLCTNLRRKLPCWERVTVKTEEEVDEMTVLDGSAVGGVGYVLPS